MSILKLKPACKDYIWGGSRLKEEYGKEFDGDVLAETWELSCHPDGPSVIANGAFAGKTLQQYIDEEGKEALGRRCLFIAFRKVRTQSADTPEEIIAVIGQQEFVENEGGEMKESDKRVIEKNYFYDKIIFDKTFINYF